MEDIPNVDGDARDQSSGTPGDGAEWSIEDFDDFTAFDDLDLGSDPSEPAQLEFGGEAVEPPPSVDAPLADEVSADDVDEPAPEFEEFEEFEEFAPTAPEASMSDHEPHADDSGGHHGGDDSVPSGEDPSPEPPRLEVVAPTGEPAPDDVAPDDGRGAFTAPEADVFDYEDVPDFSAFTQEQYVQATTQEYAGLAEDVARAAEDSPQQMAVSAGIPGLESGVVGLDDVIEGAADQDTIMHARGGSDLSVRVLTGIGLVLLFFGSLYKDYLIAVLIFVVMMVSAVEIYVAVTRAGHRPLTLFGLLGTAGALFGAWYWGPVAVPVALIVTTVATLVFFGVVAQRRAPLLDTALTVLGIAWLGGLGAFAMDIAWAEDYAWMIAAIVVTTALMDVAQYFVGRRFGKRPMSPRVSPKKTVEGLIGGVVMALLVGTTFGFFGPFELIDGVILGALVAAISPLGDLAISVVKRAIGVKDMGAILPGHGGVFDRIDAILFVIPCAWVAYSWMGLIA